MVLKRGRQRHALKMCRNHSCPGWGYRTSIAAGRPGPGEHSLKFKGLRSEWLRPGGAGLRPPVGWRVWPSVSTQLGERRKVACFWREIFGFILQLRWILEESKIRDK